MTDEKSDIILTRNQKKIKEQIQQEQTENKMADTIIKNLQEVLKNSNISQQVLKEIFRESINEFLNDNLKKSRKQEETDTTTSNSETESDSESNTKQPKSKKQAVLENFVTEIFKEQLNGKSSKQKELKIEFIDLNDMISNKKRNNEFDSETLSGSGSGSDTETETETESGTEYEKNSFINDESDDEKMNTIDTNEVIKQKVMTKAEKDNTRREKRKQFINITKDNPYYKYYAPPETCYYKKLTSQEQTHIKEQEKKYFKKEDDIPFRFKILNSKLDDNIMKIVLKKLEHLYNMRPDSGEYSKLTQYIDQICNLPIGKYITPHTEEVAQNPLKIQSYIKETKETLNKKIYGHTETKDQIVRLLAQWISKPDSKGQILGLLGKPGCGKTFLIKNVLSEIVGLPHIFIPVGGLTDASSLVGHSYTYEGSIPGMIVSQLTNVQCMNPIIIFDELDKVSESQHGKEIIGILTHLTDQTQNDHFNDKYFGGINFDLSRALMIFTYNDAELIDPILRDRITQIVCKDYDTNDKVEIAQHHLIPELLSKYNIILSEKQYPNGVFDFISKDNIKNIISQTKQEYGVRQFKQNLDLIISNYNLERLMDDKQLSINMEFVNKILHKKNQSNDDTSYQRMYT